MIPTIGFMIGMYILTRILELTRLPDRGQGVKIFAALTFLTTIVCMISLFTASTSVSTPSL